MYKIEERVRWSDVDAARIIFYGSYVRFFEYAETELFRDVGLSYPELPVLLPRVHIECDFHAAARLDDLLEVGVEVARFGESSIHLEFCVERKSDGVKVATARYVLVCVEHETFQKVHVPEELKQKLKPHTRQ